MSYEKVVIIGRPNVGKSTLYNRLAGKRKALIHHIPGTTRDRNEMPVSWNNKDFLIVDTAGWDYADSFISSEVKKQMKIALDEASVVLFVVDGKDGYHTLDGEINKILRVQQKKTILVVNKIDNAKDELKVSDFYRLAINDVIALSSTHGININELLDNITKNIQGTDKASVYNLHLNAIKIVLVGKPNVGKSSLLNALCKEQRVIVTEQPGTTREAVDIALESDKQNYVIIDTPGLHRKRKFKEDLDYLANLSAQKALARSDIAILIIDALQGIGETEAKIAELILRNNCACLIAVNKWDLVEDKEKHSKILRGELERKLSFISWSKLIYVSAKNNLRVEKILTESKNIYENFSKEIPQKSLSQVVSNAIVKNPFIRNGKMLKVINVSQIQTRPPVFSFNVNLPQILHFSYRRYLENVIRENFDFDGTPIILRFGKTNK